MRPLVRRRALLAIGVFALVAACEGPTRPNAAPVSHPSPQFTISDATTGGRAGFYFLPPMVSFAGPFTGEFDNSLSPVIRVCRWVSNACAGDDITFVEGVGKDAVALHGGSYSTVWTGTSALTVGARYRLRVYATASAPTPLGFADLLAVASSTDMGVACTGTEETACIPIVKGTPFIVRFRVETVVGPGGVAPSAVNDGPAAGSAPGDAYHGAFNTAFDLAAPALLSNDNLGTPAAAITSFGIISNGLTEAATAHAAGSATSFGAGGSLKVNADGSVSLTPPTGFTGYVVFLYRLTNEAGTSDATASVAIGRRPATSNDTYAPSLIGNVPINTATSTQFSILANDPADGMTAALVSATNGTATVARDGKFTFTPNAGFSGTATVTYRATNGFGDAPATATVSLTVGTPIWFVNAGAATNGDGRFGTPFNCLTGAGCFDPAAADGANETIASRRDTIIASARASAATRARRPPTDSSVSSSDRRMPHSSGSKD